MKVDVVPFELHHLDTIEPLSDEYLRWFGGDCPGVSWRQRVGWQAMAGPAYSVIADGKTIACGGIMNHFPGVGELWMITAADADKARTHLMLAVLRNFDNVAEQFDFVRVQVAVPENGRGFSRKLVERLGFVRETNDLGMRKAGRDGSTFHLYGKVY